MAINKNENNFLDAKSGSSSQSKPAKPKDTNKKKSFKDLFAPHERKTANIMETNLIGKNEITAFDKGTKQKILYAVVIGSFFILGLIYGTLVLVEQMTYEDISDQADQIKILHQDILAKEENAQELIAFQKKLNSAKELLDKHIYWTNFLTFMEENILSDIYFDKIDSKGGQRTTARVNSYMAATAAASSGGNYAISADTKGTYKLSGYAKDYNALANQIKVLKNKDFVLAADIKSGEVIRTPEIIEAEKAGEAATEREIKMVKFDLELKIDPKIFYK